MHTQWLFFNAEADGLAYNDQCNTWMAAHKQARAWNNGFSVANGDSWGESWQTTDDPVLWHSGSTNNVLGKWACPFLGLPVWGFEMDYRTVQNGDPTDATNSDPQPFPLDNHMDTGGVATETYNRAYWLSQIPSNAIFVWDGFVPVWPADG